MLCIDIVLLWEQGYFVTQMSDKTDNNKILAGPQNIVYTTDIVINMGETTTLVGPCGGSSPT